VLETSYKSKLPRGWSYPVGAQVLSRYLEGIDGAAERPLHFRDYHIRARHNREIRDRGEPYSIIEISYSEPSSERRPEYLKWTVSVNPVPSNKAAAVRRFVVSFGLPRIIEWLQQTRVVDAKQGRGFCYLLYDEAGQQLLFRSRLNNTEKVTQVPLPCASGINGTG
jgi:hypothetical protein